MDLTVEIKMASQVGIVRKYLSHLSVSYNHEALISCLGVSCSTNSKPYHSSSRIH